MILKSFRGKNANISELEALLAQAPAAGKALIEQESWQVRVGNKGEKESANFIDFACDTSVVLNSVDNVGNKTQANPPYVGKKPWSVPYCFDCFEGRRGQVLHSNISATTEIREREFVPGPNGTTFRKRSY